MFKGGGFLDLVSSFTIFGATLHGLYITVAEDDDMMNEGWMEWPGVISKWNV